MTPWDILGCVALGMFALSVLAAAVLSVPDMWQ